VRRYGSFQITERQQLSVLGACVAEMVIALGPAAVLEEVEAVGYTDHSTGKREYTFRVVVEDGR
jgi:hypothetical protein